MVWGRGPNSFGCGYSVVSVPLVERLLFPHWAVLALSKNQLAINIIVYFWTLNSIPLIYISILMPVLHCFDYYSSVVSIGFGKCGSSNFIVFQDCLGNLIQLLCNSIWILRSISAKKKKAAGIFIRSVLNLQVDLGCIIISVIFKYCNSRMPNIFPFI